MNSCLKLLILSAVARICEAKPREKCGVEAPDCQVDRKGNIFWKPILGSCPTTPICRPGFVLQKNPDGRCCCLSKDTSTSSPSTTICPHVVTCRNRYVWLETICECVCPPIYCPDGTVHGSDCDCVPIPTETPCQPPDTGCGRSFFWDDERCECRLGCDFIRDCPLGQEWDIFGCGCFDECPGVECASGAVATKEDGCQCVCTSPPQACKRGYVWVPFACACWLACDYIKICEEGKTWDFIECKCLGNATVTTCGPCMGNAILNSDSCDCVCPLTDDDCTGPLAYLDHDFCECRRHPCDPPMPCPIGETVDWELCRCIQRP